VQTITLELERMNEQENRHRLNPSGVLADPVASACKLTPLIRSNAAETERGRRLAAPVVEALRSNGLFDMGLPVALGGRETPAPIALRAIEEIAYADGSTGWNVMIAFDAGLLGGFLRAAGARALIASISHPIVAASLNPPGRMLRTEKGYRLSGRWRFGSGCQQADVFIVGAALWDGAEPVIGTNGMPEMLEATLRAAEVEILDTWRVVGLRGTGSHDFAVDDVFVDEHSVQPLNLDMPVETRQLYIFPFYATLAVAKAAVALGIARAAIENLKDLAQTKNPTGQPGLLRERPAVQADLARAEALVRSARAFLYEVVGEVWLSVADGNTATSEQRAFLRLAAVDGVQRAVQAVDLMYNAAGATAIYESSPLERCFRDAHVVPAHIVVQPAVYEVAGRVLLNLPPGTTLF
jgi:alkylation response protein AidB-like acyl-CoA dehydrogenase